MIQIVRHIAEIKITTRLCGVGTTTYQTSGWWDSNRDGQSYEALSRLMFDPMHFQNSAILIKIDIAISHITSLIKREYLVTKLNSDAKYVTGLCSSLPATIERK